MSIDAGEEGQALVPRLAHGRLRLDYSVATTCPNGHDLRAHNVLYVDGAGRRSCGECRRKRDRQARANAVRRVREQGLSLRAAKINAERGRPPAGQARTLNRREMIEQAQIQERLLWLGDIIDRGALRPHDQLVARAELAQLRRRVRL